MRWGDSNKNNAILFSPLALETSDDYLLPGDRRKARSTGDTRAKQEALEEERRRAAGRGSHEVEFDRLLSDKVVNGRYDFHFNLEVV